MPKIEAAKECWQLKNRIQTPCFQKAGNFPCSAPVCAVEKHVQDLNFKGTKIDEWWEWILSHTVCRLSLFSLDNKEYFTRINKPD